VPSAFRCDHAFALQDRMMRQGKKKEGGEGRDNGLMSVCIVLQVGAVEDREKEERKR